MLSDDTLCKRFSYAFENLLLAIAKGNDAFPRQRIAMLEKLKSPIITDKIFSAGAYKARVNLPDTQFRRAYERGDLPIAVEHRGYKNVIKWKVTLHLLHLSPEGYVGHISVSPANKRSKPLLSIQAEVNKPAHHH